MIKKIIFFQLFVLYFATQNAQNDSVAKVNDSTSVVTLVVENPNYPGCKGTSEEKEKCTFSKFFSFVGKNVDINRLSKFGYKGKYRFIATFIIDENGNIKDITVDAPQIEFVNETKRVLEKMPKIEPGTKNGKPTSVKYFLPITLQF